MDTVIVEPNEFCGSYLIQVISANLLYPDLELTTVDRNQLDSIIKNNFKVSHIISKNERKWLLSILPELDNLSLIKTRLIDQLVIENRKVLYITYDMDDIDLLKKKRKIVQPFEVKKFLSQLTEESYNFIKGADYPDWSEFCAGNVHPELVVEPDDVEWERDPLNQWKYNIPDFGSDCLLKITFKQVLNGYDLIEDIAKFLEVNIIHDQKPLIDDYRSKFLEVDY